MIDEPARVVSMCQLSLPAFEGSADTLLTLVAHHKLSADEVPVADVTRQFLAHMTESQDLDLNLAAELMAASARLMMMKSSQLLVQPDDGADEDTADSVFDSTARRQFASAIESLASREGLESFLPLASPVEIERRSEPRSPHLLLRAWGEMSGRVTRSERRVSVPSFVRLETAVSGLIRMLRSRAKLMFRDAIGDSNRNDIVVHFMAMLELVRQRRLRVEQDDLFTDITMHWIADNAESSSRLG